MKDTFASSIKFFQGKLKEKRNEKSSIKKSEKDFEDFLTEYDKFYYFYN